MSLSTVAPDPHTTRHTVASEGYPEGYAYGRRLGGSWDRGYGVRPKVSTRARTGAHAQP